MLQEVSKVIECESGQALRSRHLLLLGGVSLDRFEGHLRLRLRDGAEGRPCEGLLMI